MKITRENLLTGEKNTLDLSITEEQYDAWQSGMLIQNAMPNLSAEEREFLVSGLLPGEFDKIFKKKKIKKSAEKVLSLVTIKFKIGNKEISFEIAHNLNDFKLDIESALTNWVYRTKKHTAKSFCDYVVSKDPENIICITKEQIEKINKK